MTKKTFLKRKFIWFQKPWVLLLVLAVSVLSENPTPEKKETAPVEDQKVEESKQETKTLEAQNDQKTEATAERSEEADSSKPKRGLHSWGYGYDDGFSQGGSQGNHLHFSQGNKLF